MNKKPIKYFYYLLTLILVFAPKLALAVDTEVGEASGITEYITALLGKLLPIIAGLALLMVIYAGYLYMTSQGNPETTGRAKDILVGVIVGLILLFLTSVILNQIGVK